MSERLVEFMGAVTGWLNGAEIPYMVAGSFASTYHGHPRATQDVVPHYSNRRTYPGMKCMYSVANWRW